MFFVGGESGEENKNISIEFQSSYRLKLFGMPLLIGCFREKSVAASTMIYFEKI